MDNTDPAASTPPTTPAEPVADTTQKADLGRRFIAALIDGVIAWAIALIIGILPGIGDLLGGIAGGLYILLRDGLDYDYLRHRSVGKTLMRLRPTTLAGGAVDVNTSIQRNWTLALGYLGTIFWMIPILGWLVAILLSLAALVIGIVEVVLVLTDPEGRRWGDKLAGTKVIETEEAVAG